MLRVNESLEAVSLHEYVYLVLSLEEHALIRTGQSVRYLRGSGVVQVHLCIII